MGNKHIDKETHDKLILYSYEELEGKKFINNKNKSYYYVKGIIVNATNNVDGQVMIMYSVVGDTRSFCREYKEFFEKFTEVRFNNSYTDNHSDSISKIINGDKHEK